MQHRFTFDFVDLQPAFTYLADATRQQKSEASCRAMAEYWAAQRLYPEAVNEAVRRIILGWDKAFWPTAEYIAVRARQLQRETMDELHGIPGTQRWLDDHCDAECQRQWDERQHVAETWFAEHPERGKAALADVDRDIADRIRRKPHGLLATRAEYHAAWREGAVVGACLAELGRDRMRRLHRAEQAERAAPRTRVDETLNRVAA